jgi:hypothetical protein
MVKVGQTIRFKGRRDMPATIVCGVFLIGRVLVSFVFNVLFVFFFLESGSCVPLFLLVVVSNV